MKDRYMHLHARKGKSYEEIYGVEKSLEIKEKQRLDKEKNNNYKGQKHSEESISKMKETKRQKVLDGWNYPTKGKNYEKLYGVDEAVKRKEKLRISHIGQKSNKKGKSFEEIYGGKKSKKLKNRIKKTLKIKHKNGELQCPEWMKEKGRTPWNKGKIGVYKLTEETKNKISDSLTGREVSKETRKKLSESNIRNGHVGIWHPKFKSGYYNSKNNGKVWHRSGWELSTMKYFDKNDISWIYETNKNKFYISTINKYYMNDFYLPNEDKYIQVKGYLKPDDKFFLFKDEYKDLHCELWNYETLKNKGIL